MKTSAEKLREMAREELSHIDDINSPEWCATQRTLAAIYSTGALIIDAMPDEEERLTLTLVPLVDKEFEESLAEVYDMARKQARAILAERDGGER